MKRVRNSDRSSKAGVPEKTGAPSDPGGQTNPTGLEMVKMLSSEEKQHLAELEKVIDAKLADFFEVGSALTEIKTKELYRETHSNFNTYCQLRWGFGRSYANKLIGSAERILLLPKDVPKPANEFQIRPFLDLKPEQFPQKWQEIVKTAGPGKVTSKIVEDSLNLPKKKRRKRKAKPSGEKAGAIELIEGIRAALQEKNMESALKQLDKLEKFLKT